MAPGARWPSQGRSTEAAPPASPNWSPTFEGSRTTLPGRGQRVCIGESGPEANSRAPSVSPLRYQISAFNGVTRADDSADLENYSCLVTLKTMQYKRFTRLGLKPYYAD